MDSSQSSSATLLFLLLLPLILSIGEASPLGASTLWSFSQLAKRNTDAHNRKFDYIIVGGGTAGLTIASRLTENPKITVAVIEAGDFYEKVTGNASEIPANDVLYGGKDPADTGPTDWDFVTTPQAGLNGQSVHYARGKALGGSSALNYMNYERTTIGTLQRWADDVGDQSYTYSQVSKYYAKSLNFTPPDQTKRFANTTPEYDGSTLPSGGLLDVSYPNYAQPFSTWWAKGAAAVGMNVIRGFTSGKLINGSSWFVNTINHANGFRESSETAFLQPSLGRKNLVLYTNTLAEKILFDGTVAKAVRASSNDTSITLTAAREVIVSCGVFQSPHLLQVSGVGPSTLLAQHKIKLIVDRPGVGANLQDNIFIAVTYRVNIQTISSLTHPDVVQEAVIQFDEEAAGLLSSPGGDYGAYEKVSQHLRASFTPSALKALSTFPSDWPDFQFFSVPIYADNFSFPLHVAQPNGYEYASLACASIAPLPRGNISISSAWMHDPPLINPNWLTDPTDIQVAIAAFRRIREILSTNAMAPVLIRPEFYPGHQNVSSESDEQILAYYKNSFSTMSHASATCAMGKASDPMAVVDSRARVYGVRNLRVVDASAFPFAVPGLPMATVYMLAEKIADDIKSDW